MTRVEKLFLEYGSREQTTSALDVSSYYDFFASSVGEIALQEETKHPSTRERVILPRRTADALPRRDFAGLLLEARSENIRLRLDAEQSAAIRKMALLLPGHNEELIIATTIKSAIAAGQDIQDIFVVDDCSDDNTYREAVNLLGELNVLRVQRSGKALAVQKAIDHFSIAEQFEWIHIADADSVFGPNYFRIYRGGLNDPRYVVALGFVQSLRGNWISKYRAFTYTYSQHIFRRFQSYLGMISVFPGPITCFRTSILDELEFDGNSLTEDFDITLQVHRKKLGKIKFIPSAVNYTQDPQHLDDFIKQNQRWQRGFFQGLLKYKIGTKLQPIDVGIMYQMTELVFYTMQMFIFLPIFLITTGNWQLLPVIIAADYALLAIMAVLSAFMARRWSIIVSLPYFYVLRFIEQAVFYQAFIEVVLLRKYRSKSTGWVVAGRRYAISTKALLDTAG